MAVYAAYRHIELDNIGYGKKRVLKPPGGGSSDIFGSDAEVPRARNTNHLQSSVFGNMMETTATKSKLSDAARTSNIALFGSETSVDDFADHKNQELGHSFFESEEGKLNDLASDEAADVVAAGADRVDKPIVVETVLESHEARDSRRNPINHNGMTAADCTQSCNQRGRTYQQKPVGNPVTGEGYAIANGVKEMAASPVSAAPLAAASPSRMTNGSAAKTNGSAPVAAAAAPPAANRGRVPPGGFSSGLW